MLKVENDAHDSLLVQFVQYFRRNGRREHGSKPPNWHFDAATGSANAAEMTQLRRMARLVPPLHKWQCRCRGCEGGIRGSDYWHFCNNGTTWRLRTN